MKITPQDIIDKEFRVKFRGFDMVEVDTFLEEVAENLFKLNEENTRLNEQILSLQNDLDTGGKASPQGPMELPAELSNYLEELKQDTAAINAELVALKQDRSAITSLEKNIKGAIASLAKSSPAAPPQGQAELPADFSVLLDDFKKGTAAMHAELAALKEDRQALDILKKQFEEFISSAAATESTIAPQAQGEIPSSLAKDLEAFGQDAKSLREELAALSQEVGTIGQIRQDIKSELQELLKSHFETLDAKLSQAPPAAAPASAPVEPKSKAAAPAEKKETLVATIIQEAEDAEMSEDTSLPGFEEQADASDDVGLDFMSEDDILDVDKLRGVFQSVLDDSVSNESSSRIDDNDDSGGDLLFFSDDDVEDEHEPEVTFSVDEDGPDKKSRNKEKGK
ncbi:DivIVA domain-containing protein [Thermodesulfobacteriota bacterium]